MTLTRSRCADDEKALAGELFSAAHGGGVTEILDLDLPSLETSWGVRVRTRGRNPLVTQLLKTPTGGIWVNTGYYKSGIILSWMLAGDISTEIAAQITGV